MATVAKWLFIALLTTLLVLTLGVIALFVLLDTGRLTGSLENAVSRSLGRAFTIAGAVEASLLPRPRLVLNDIRLANAPWSASPQMARLQRIGFQFEPRGLFRGKLVLSQLHMNGVELLLERSGDEQQNWDFPAISRGAGVNGGLLERLAVERLEINAAELVYEDHAGGISERLLLNKLVMLFDPDSGALEMRAGGHRRGQSFSLALDTALGRPQVSGPLQFRFDGEDIQVELAGTVADPWLLQGLDAGLTLHGQEPAWLLPAGLSLPLPAKAYSLEGMLRRHGYRWQLDDLQASLGRTQLRGDLVLALGGQRPLLQADLHAPVIDLEELQGRQEQGQEPPADGPPIPEVDFQPDWFRILDADMEFTSETLHMGGLTLNALSLGLLLRAGHLRLEPLGFAILDGAVDGGLELRADRLPPEAELQLEVSNIALNEVLNALGFEVDGFGEVQGRIHISGIGESLGAMLSGMNGNGSLVMADGQLDQYLLTLAQQDLSSVVEYLTGQDEEVTKARCVVADFQARDGVVSMEQLVIDSPQLKIIGEGSINLETLALDFQLLPRDADFSVDPGRDAVLIQGIRGEVEMEIVDVEQTPNLTAPIPVDVASDPDCQDLARAVREAL